MEIWNFFWFADVGESACPLLGSIPHSSGINLAVVLIARGLRENSNVGFWFHVLKTSFKST